MKKNIPNIITIMRIVFSFTLLLTCPASFEFFAIFLACGITDVLDGFLARKWKVCSKSGAMLDSVADLIFIAVILIVYLPSIRWKAWMLIWIVGIAVIRGLSILMGFLRFQTLVMIHTYGNKATGLILFCFPVLYFVAGLSITCIFVCSVAIVSALEELLIIITCKEPDRDRKGMIFS